MKIIPSYYNRYIHHGDNYLIYNLYKSTAVLLKESEFKRFEDIAMDFKHTEELLRLGMYVKEDFSEIDYLLLKSRIISANDNHVFFRIYTTYDCNAKCYYCYEKDVNKVYMSHEVAKKTISFIKNNTPKNSKLTIEWFGGEPLLNIPIIDYISKEIKEYSILNDIYFRSRVITNGLLINESIILKSIKHWNLNMVQITLDGPKSMYEKIKNYEQADGFETVLDNIENLLNKKVKVNIRLNYDDSRINEIIGLIDLLYERFGKYDTVNVYSKRIMNDESENNTTNNIGDMKIFNKLVKVGFVKDILATIPNRVSKCVAYKINSYIVDPNGNVGKCSQSLAKNEIVGDIYKGINIEKIVNWCTPRLDKKCFYCEILPTCYGGCMYEYYRGKEFCFSTKEFIDYKLKFFFGESLIIHINTLKKTNNNYAYYIFGITNILCRLVIYFYRILERRLIKMLILKDSEEIKEYLENCNNHTGCGCDTVDCGASVTH